MVTIYGLFCIHTGEVYVGCTAGKLGKRMREHRCLLNNNRHSAKKMQSLWNIHGPSGFRLNPIESLNKDASVIDKRKRELYWMEYYDAQGLLLNHCKASFEPPAGSHEKAIKRSAEVRRGTKQTPESNEKRRLAQLGKPKNNGAKISATKRRLGQRPSLEACSKGGKSACALRYGTAENG